jgi:Tol biopolymer transport system component
MIEITHSQARRLIRATQDVAAGGRGLPEEQWAALQAHLENCAECRRFRERCAAEEVALGRSFALRWDGILGPVGDLLGAVLQYRWARARRQRILSRAAVALVAALVFLALGGLPRLAGSPSLPTAAPTLAPSLTPGEPSDSFRGVVAFAAESPGGSSDIFLLTSSPELGASELANLSQHPAADRDPAWSPDGQWLAFLSDRDSRPGQLDLYVINVAGTRLTRLTHLANRPGPAWVGPLSWSADGRWIAGLVSRPDGQGHWIYRVALDGGPPLALDGPNVPGPVRFSPQGALLAFQRGPDSAGLERVEVYNVETGALLQLTRAESLQGGMRAGRNAAFDWSADGRSLAYISDGPYAAGGDPAAGAISQIRLTVELLAEQFILYESAANLSAIQARRPAAYRSVTWGPRDELVFLQDPDGDGCWTLFTRAAYFRGETPRALDGLCLQAGGELPGLDRGNWASSERWLVAPAYPPGAPPGLYAIRIPIGDEPFHFERLGDAAGLAGALRVRPSRPVRVEGRRALAIDPRPTGAFDGAELPGLLPPAGLLDRLLLVEERRDGVAIMRGMYASDSLAFIPSTGGELQTGALRVMAGEGANTCPVWSPDGQRIAYLSDGGANRLPAQEVYLMDAAGAPPTRLTWLPFRIRSTTGRRVSTPGGFECPVWSPDGIQLASVVRGQDQDYLAIVPVTRSAAITGPARANAVDRSGDVLTDWTGARYIPLGSLPSGARPSWDPTGQRILVPYLETPGPEGSILAIDPQSPGSRRFLVGADGWQAVDSPVFSPSGRWMAYAALNFRGDGALAQLRIADSGGNAIHQWVSLPHYQTSRWSVGNSEFTWWGDDTFTGWPNAQPDGQIGLVVRDAPGPDGRAFLLVYYPNPGVTHVLAELDETMYDAVWSSDGQWAIYSADSGVWAINVPAALAGQAGPALLSRDLIVDLELD